MVVKFNNSVTCWTFIIQESWLHPAKCIRLEQTLTTQNLKRSNMKIKNTKHKQHFHRQSEPCSLCPPVSSTLQFTHGGELSAFFCHHDIFSWHCRVCTAQIPYFLTLPEYPYYDILYCTSHTATTMVLLAWLKTRSLNLIFISLFNSEYAHFIRCTPYS